MSNDFDRTDFDNILSETSKATMNALKEINIPDKSIDKIKESLMELRNKIGLKKEDKFDVINTGPRNTPQLGVYVGERSLETINVDIDNNVDVKLHREGIDSYKLENEVNEKTCKFIEQNSKGNKLLEATLDIKKEASELVAPVPEKVNENFASKSENKIEISGVELVRKSFEKQGIDMDNPPSYVKKLLKQIEKDDRKIDKQIEKNKKKAARMNVGQRAEKVKEYRSEKSNLKDMQKELKQELSIAKINGADEDTISHILGKAEKITETTNVVAGKRDEIPSLTSAIVQSINDKGKELTNTVKSLMSKVKVGLDMKVNSGINAIGKMKDAVQHANEQFFAHKDTAYTDLSEKISQIERNWMAVNHSLNQGITKRLDKVHDSLKKAYERKSEITNAVKDVGRAITGKERLKEPSTISPEQQSILNKVSGMSNYLKQEMKDIERNYEVSREASIFNMKGAQEHRMDVGLNVSDSLQKNIEKAVSKSIKTKTVAKAAPTKVADDRIR